MYAIIKDSGRQYKVEKNSEILVDIRKADTGSEILFDSVVAIGDNGKIETDGKNLQGKKVTGIVLGPQKGEKVIVGKYKKRKKMRRKTGHRQQYLRVKINNIA